MTLLLAAPAAGRWLVLGGAALVGGRVGRTESLFALLEVVVIGLVVVGLTSPKAGWSRPLLLITLVTASLPVVRTTALTGTVTVAGEALPITLPLSRLQAPGLGVHLLLGLDLIPLGLALWLVPLRPARRRDSLPVVAWGVAGALAALVAVPTAVYVASLGGAPTIAATDAGRRLEADVRADGLTSIACSATSDVLRGPMIRPFVVGVVVAEAADRPVVVIDRVDAASGAVEGPAVRFAPRDPLPAAQLCSGLALDPSIRITTSVPPHR